MPAYLFIAPNLLGVALFVAFPMLFALYMSVHDWNGVNAARFIGARNFTDLASDPLFWQSLKVTTIYTLLTVPTTIVVSLGLAMLLHQRIRGLVFFRTCMFIPVVTSALAVSVVWKWIFDYDNGLLNDLLNMVNLPSVPWLGDPAWALVSLAIIGVWKGFGLTTIILLAAIHDVPESLLEAAALDGAGPWSSFRRITLPLIVPAVLFVSVVSFISSFQVFDQVYYITVTNVLGGPENGTMVMNLLIFQRAFLQNRFGAASALAYVLFAIILAVTMLQLRFGRTASSAAAQVEV